MYRPNFYSERIRALSPKSPIWKDALRAFLFGGSLCLLCQGLFSLYSRFLAEREAYLTVTVTVIGVSAILTGLGAYDRIARFAGAGTLVPVSGFANSVVSPALDTKSEGFVLGVGPKIFTVAGPVILYATLAGSLYGLILYIVSLFGGM
jgi:stage V sporulation protein AC